MSAIFYMLRKEWKNRFLALFRHPGKLVVYILLVLLQMCIRDRTRSI